MDIVIRPKVSIISAIFNEEQYLEEFLSSILNQTYDNIELICVDDGSNDRSALILRDYRKAFEKKQMVLKYVYQENAGQAAATNRALKLISGKYLCWIDGDDYIYEDAVEQKVNFLEEHPNYGMVTSDFYLFYEKSGQRVLKGELYGNLNYISNQFELAMAGESVIENLAHMINVELFKRINPKLEINECREGQNYQIILPMLYHYKRGFINKALGCYRIHEDSHCHRLRNKEEQIARYDSLIIMISEVLKEIGISDDMVEYIMRNSTFNIERGRYIDNVRD